MIAFHVPHISGLADGWYRANVGFELTLKLGLNGNDKLRLKFCLDLHSFGRVCNYQKKNFIAALHFRMCFSQDYYSWMLTFTGWLGSEFDAVSCIYVESLFGSQARTNK